MAKKHNYIDNVVIKLKRAYEKDELVAYIIKKYRELEVENGILKSERDEAVYIKEKALKIDNDTKSRYGQLKAHQNMKREIKELREKCRKLKTENDKLLYKTLNPIR